ncbi:MAG TPA: tRNA lysidine(34) synthetase TilS [Lacibacter sp.]|nr:tRNA lysidine(34) synthetase TilS [Lacibacter sp.]
MNLGERFLQHIRSEDLFHSDHRLFIAVSGGLDSVVLAHLCFNAGYRFSLVHCNFRLRGEESDADEVFVRELGESLGLPVLVQSFDTAAFARAERMSIQEAARLLRYNWWEELVQEELWQAAGSLHPDHVQVLTAHHADDNAETLLMHFCRGTGLRGLTGIPVRYGSVCRPLLPFTREELKHYATEHGLLYREDSSNASARYTRNVIRNQVLPLLRTQYPQVDANLQDNIRRFTDIEALYQLTLEPLKKKLLRPRGAEWVIPVALLRQYNNKALVYELIRSFGFGEKQVEEVWKLLEAPSGRFIESPRLHYRIIRHRNGLVISPAAPDAGASRPINENEQEVYFEHGSLVLCNQAAVPAQPDASPRRAQLDARQLRYPLLLRRWKAGDYFYPLGMRKKKKVARFLIDLKLSRSEKEHVWVLESEHRIVWVIGYRIDDRFKLTPATKQLLDITWTGGTAVTG